MAIPLILGATARHFGWSGAMRTLLRKSSDEERAELEARRVLEMGEYEIRLSAHRAAEAMRITYDAPDMSKVFADYVRLSKLSVAQVLIKKGRDLSVQLYRQFRVYTPTRERILAECIASLQAGKGLKIRERAWGSPRVVAYTKAGRMNRRMTAIQSEIRERQIHRFATSATWLFNRWRPSPTETGRKLMPNNKVQGGKGNTMSVIVYRLDGPSPFIEFRNSTPGVVEQENRHQLIQKALTQVVGDMLIYIAAQHRKNADYFNRRNAPTERFVGQRALYNLVHR